MHDFFDPNSRTWMLTQVRLQAEIDDALRELERQGSEPEFQRGRIAAARSILTLADPEPKVPAAPKY